VTEGFLRVIFVKLADNLSDGFTKNVNGEIYEGHKDAYVADRDYVDEDDSG